MGKNDLIEFDLSDFNINQVTNRKYFADKDGNIYKKNTKTDQTKLLQSVINNGYHVVWVTDSVSGKRTCIYVRRIIALLFHKFNPYSGDYIINIDHDKLNSSSENIKVVNKTEWLKHYKVFFTKMKGVDRSQNPPNPKLTTKNVIQIKKLISEKKQINVIARKFNISPGQIYRIRRGENWKNISV